MPDTLRPCRPRPAANLCELSVPGTEARCRPSHYRLSDDPQLRTSARCSRAGATAGGRTEMRGFQTLRTRVKPRGTVELAIVAQTTLGLRVRGWHRHRTAW